MTSDTQTALKVIVERAVRPVRATFERKRRMREELLAHVTDVFNEEVTKTANETAAVAATEERFGDAGRVAIELQRSVSRYDRAVAAFERITLARPDEGAVRRAFRWGLFVLVVMTLFDGPALLLTHVVNHQGRDWSLVGAAFVSLVAGSSLATFEFVLLGGWLRSALFVEGRRSVAKAVAIGLAALLVPAATVFADLLLITRDAIWSVFFMGQIAVFAPLSLAIVFLVARKFDEERSYCDEWASLSIDSAN